MNTLCYFHTNNILQASSTNTNCLWASYLHVKNLNFTFFLTPNYPTRKEYEHTISWKSCRCPLLFSGWQLSNYICKSFVNVRMKSVSLLSLKYHIASILCWATLHRVLAVLKRKCTHYMYRSTLRNSLYTVSLKLCT